MAATKQRTFWRFAFAPQAEIGTSRRRWFILPTKRPPEHDKEQWYCDYRAPPRDLVIGRTPVNENCKAGDFI